MEKCMEITSVLFASDQAAQSANSTEDLASKELLLLHAILESSTNSSSLINMEYKWNCHYASALDEGILSLTITVSATLFTALQNRSVLIRCTSQRGVVTHMRQLVFSSSSMSAMVSIPHFVSDISLSVTLPYTNTSLVTALVAEPQQYSDTSDSTLQVLRTRHPQPSSSCASNSVFSCCSKSLAVRRAREFRRSLLASTRKQHLLPLIREDMPNESYNGSSDMFSLPMKLQETEKHLRRIIRRSSINNASSSSYSKEHAMDDMWLCYKVIREHGT